MASLFTAHAPALQALYSDLKRRAQEQETILVGTPGSVGTRSVNERPFLYRQFYDARGRKAAHYIGPADDEDAIARADAVRQAVATTNELLSDARILARQGYVRVDGRVGAIGAALSNHGLFRAGLTLVGSHAYGASLNELGVKAASFRTEDLDLVRSGRLHLSGVESFEAILGESTLKLSPVLGFDRKSPPTSFMAQRPDRFRIDLLAPGTGNEPKVRAAPELRAHVLAMPHLGYVVEEPLDAILLGRESVIPLRIPRPERLAFHKMSISQLRTATSDKREKDLSQAAVLTAVLTELEPGVLETAWRDVPRSARRSTTAGAERVAKRLESVHARASELLRSLTGA